MPQWYPVFRGKTRFMITKTDHYMRSELCCTIRKCPLSLKIISFFLKKKEDTSPFVAPLFWTSGKFCPGFQSQAGCLDCVLHCLYAINTSDSPLVWQLPTPWWPAWQLSLFEPRTYTLDNKLHDILTSQSSCVSVMITCCLVCSCLLSSSGSCSSGSSNINVWKY